MNLKFRKFQSIQAQLTYLFNEQKIPNLLREKAMEYFEYCWRKNVVFDEEFSDF